MKTFNKIITIFFVSIFLLSTLSTVYAVETYQEEVMHLQIQTDHETNMYKLGDKSYEVFTHIEAEGKSWVSFKVNGEFGYLEDRYMSKTLGYPLYAGESITVQGLRITVDNIYYGADGKEYVTFYYNLASQDVPMPPKPPAKTTLSMYPDFLIKDNKILDAYAVVGSKAPVADILAISDIVLGIQDNPLTTTVMKVEINAAILDNELDDLYEKNLIAVGNPANNKIVAKVIRHDFETIPGLEHDQGFIRLYNKNNKYQLIVTGNSDVGIRKAARVLSNWKDYNLQGTRIIVDGTFEKPRIIVISNEIFGGYVVETPIEEEEPRSVPVIEEEETPVITPVVPEPEAPTDSVICHSDAEGVVSCTKDDLKIGDKIDLSVLKGIDYSVHMTVSDIKIDPNTGKHEVLLFRVTESETNPLMPAVEPFRLNDYEEKVFGAIHIKLTPMKNSTLRLKYWVETEKPTITTTYCSLNDRKLPIGIRTNNQYCDIDGKWKNQKPGNAPANNNFECNSNLALDGKCIESGFIAKVLNFLRSLFGLK